MARRIVTDIDVNGKSYAIFDGPAPASVNIGNVTLDDLWIDDPASPGSDATTDTIDPNVNRLVPPAHGSVVRVVTFFPEGFYEEPSEAALAENLSRWDPGDAIEEGEAGEEGWHTTQTIDYGIVLSGEIDLGLDSGWIRMTPGDIVVQRATRHAWRPTDDGPCAVAFVLIASPNYQD